MKRTTSLKSCRIAFVLLILSLLWLIAASCDLGAVPNGAVVILEDCGHLRLSSIGTRDVSLSIRRSNISFWAFNDTMISEGVMNVSITLEGCIVLNGLHVFLDSDIATVVNLSVRLTGCVVDLGGARSDCNHTTSIGCSNTHILLITPMVGVLLSNIGLFLSDSTVRGALSNRDQLFNASDYTVAIGLLCVGSWSSSLMLQGATVVVESCNLSFVACTEGDSDCSVSSGTILLRGLHGDTFVSAVSISLQQCDVHLESPVDTKMIMMRTYDYVVSNVHIFVYRCSLWGYLISMPILPFDLGRSTTVIACGGGRWTNITILVHHIAIVADTIVGDAVIQDEASSISAVDGSVVQLEMVGASFFTIDVFNVSLFVNATRGTYSSVYGSIIAAVVSSFRLRRSEFIIYIRDANVTLLSRVYCPRSRNVTVSVGQTRKVISFSTSGGIVDVFLGSAAFLSYEEGIKVWATIEGTSLSMVESHSSLAPTHCTAGPVVTIFAQSQFPAHYDVNLFHGAVVIAVREFVSLTIYCTGLPQWITAQSPPPLSYQPVTANITVGGSQATNGSNWAGNMFLQAAAVLFGCQLVDSHLTVAAGTRITAAAVIMLLREASVSGLHMMVHHNSIGRLTKVIASNLSRADVSLENVTLTNDCNASSSAIEFSAYSSCKQCALNLVGCRLPSVGKVVRVEQGSSWEEGSFVTAQCTAGSDSQLALKERIGVSPAIVASYTGDCLPMNEADICFPSPVRQSHNVSGNNRVVAAAMVTSFFSGGVLRSPMAMSAMFGSRLSATQGCLSITFEDFSDGNYFQWSLGSDEKRLMRGTVVGNILLSAGFFTVSLLAVGVVSRIKNEHWRASCSLLGFPSLLFPVTEQWLLMPCTAGSIAMLIDGDCDGIDYFIVALGLCYGLLTLVWAAATLKSAERQSETIQCKASVSKRSRLVAMIRKLTWRPYEWKDTRVSQYFVSMHGSMFDCFLRQKRWYALIEVGTAVLYGGLQGLASSGRLAVCDAAKVGFATSVIASFLGFLALRPHMVLFETLVAGLLLGLGALYGLVMLVSVASCGGCDAVAETIAQVQLYCTVGMPILALLLNLLSFRLRLNKMSSTFLKGAVGIFVRVFFSNDTISRPARAASVAGIDSRIGKSRQRDQRLKVLVELICDQSLNRLRE